MVAILAVPLAPGIGSSPLPPASRAPALPSVAPLAPTAPANQAGSLLFIENRGQFDAAVRFQAELPGTGTLWLTDDGLWLSVVRPTEEGQATARDTAVGRNSTLENPLGQRAAPRRLGVNLKIDFVGANPAATPVPFRPSETVVSYFRGSDPAGWRPEVPVWHGVRYPDLYPGIDLEIVGTAAGWTWRAHAREEADLSRVRLRVEGVTAAALEGTAADPAAAMVRLATAAGPQAGVGCLPRAAKPYGGLGRGLTGLVGNSE